MSTKTKEIVTREKRRKETLEEALTSKDFYSLNKVLSNNPDIICLIGQRSNGKTYSTLKYALENYKKSGGRTFVYVRRWAEDVVVKNMSKLFDPLPVDKIFGQGCYITFFRGAFIVKKHEEFDDPDDPWEPITVGWAIALNQVAHTKSQTFDKAQVVLGNTVSKYSPYFTPYGIDINSMKQGEIKVIELPNEKGEPTRVVVEWCEYNPKVGQKTSKYIRNSRMAKTGQWEIEDVSNIPHCDNEVATEKLLCSMLDSVMGVNLGIFVRTAVWNTLEVTNGIYHTVPHQRQFLVIRQTQKISHYYHLTNVKDLTYSSWSVLSKMWKAIEEETGIDIDRELDMGRVYAEDSFTADYFYHSVQQYENVSLRDLL